MKFRRKTFDLLLAAILLTPSWVHAADTTAGDASERVIRFQLCSSNVKNIGLYKQSGLGNLWHFVVILNDDGTKQFADLQKKRFGDPVEIVWAGVEFGRRRLNIIDLSAAHNLMLVSKWENYRRAQAKMALLHRRLLHKDRLDEPCGAAPS